MTPHLDSEALEKALDFVRTSRTNRAITSLQDEAAMVREIVAGSITAYLSASKPNEAEGVSPDLRLRLFVHPESASLFVAYGAEASALATGDAGDGMSWEVTDDQPLIDKFIAQQRSVSPPSQEASEADLSRVNDFLRGVEARGVSEGYSKQWLELMALTRKIIRSALTAAKTARKM